jgi:hypothetical protein
VTSHSTPNAARYLCRSWFKVFVGIPPLDAVRLRSCFASTRIGLARSYGLAVILRMIVAASHERLPRSGCLS